MTEECPIHDRELKPVAENKFRCPAGHDVHESAVGREDLFQDLRNGDNPALAQFAEALLNFEGQKDGD